MINNIKKSLDNRDFPLLIFPQEPQPDTDIHKHNFTELVIIKDGDGIHFTDTVSHKVTTGDVFVIQRGQPHGYSNCKNLHLINVLFDKEKLKYPLFDLQLFSAYHAMFVLEPQFRKEKCFKSHLKINQHQLERTLSITKQIQNEFSEKKPGYQRLSLSYLLQLIIYLSRCYAKCPTSAAQPFIRIGEVITYLEHNMTKQVSLEKLTSIAHMSTSSLTRTFKRSTGCTPIEYFIRLKINRACELLKDSECSISKIAELVGFSDSNYFTRQFSRIKGVSPREYCRFINS